MDVIWWGIPIAGCVALAACVAAALLPPRRDEPETLRPLANTDRLTALPEYARAIRRHTIAAVVAVATLALAFAATALAVARPTGLPAPQRHTVADQPEDIMVCVGAPVDDPAVNGALRYFAEQARGFGTERIGLTSANRRVIPLTRDYQYAAGQFARYGQPAGPLVAPVSYSDYTATVEDVLAMCLTGFPDFQDRQAQRRSLIYIGPGTLGDDTLPTVFTADQVRELAVAAGVQVNAVSDGEGLPAELSRETGGQVHPETDDPAAYLSDIRHHPPQPPGDSGVTTARSAETPDLLLLAAAVALIALLARPLVVRR
jgi:hypothetical protein